ncbi:hypothetical protein ONZ51_g5696 [Trametes cubensis]|uniref:Uncharacterized protein n=1 Tax=Trametes cubensis TaxID=1111947 RepID=A0AAD7XBA3_9APHY|nr:hypothetical protein ONZ51_g5696 [Trametes cubensis]
MPITTTCGSGIPDDVWLAILTQLCFYVNAHAEELRHYFVAHEGKKELIVQASGTRYTVDFGALSRQMTKKIHENVLDSTLVDWILPDFTTTTVKDTTICSVVMMSTLKAYFEYTMDIVCGIPYVTLEGTKADWEKLVKRLNRLYEMGDEPSVWAEMLRPILRRFVSAFDGEPDVQFWEHVLLHQQEMCGQDDITGWLTAFCVWDHRGKWKAGKLPETIPRLIPEKTVSKSGLRGRLSKVIRRLSSSSSRTSASAAVEQEQEQQQDDRPHGSVLTRGHSWALYTLDGVKYFTVPIGMIPAGYCEVDVKVVDNGERVDCLMVAGHVAVKATATSGKGARDTLSPAPQWFIFEKR